MELVDMRDLKFRPAKGPGSTPGTGILQSARVFLHIRMYLYI